ncbi:zinc ABC transporter permease [Atopobacter sp. AH10]|nr:zinc ABC transporter permease [Atopobacter sp. AH10]
MEVFFYGFMQKAFIAASLMGILAPILGIFLILRQQSLLADTLSHVSLIGIALGVLLGFNPTYTTLLIVVLTAIGLEEVARSFKGYSEVSIAIVMSVGMAVALVLMRLQESTTSMSINQFLFGSIIAITNEQLLVLAALTLLVLIGFSIFRKPLYVLMFDAATAHTAGLPVRLMSTLLTVAIGAVIAVIMPIAGALLVSAVIILPGAIALQLATSFKTAVVSGVISGVLGMYLGLFASYAFDTPPGATITICLAILLVLAITLRKSRARFSLKK